MRMLVFSLGLACLVAVPLAAAENDKGVSYTNKSTNKVQIGVVVTAAGGPVSGIRATVPVPTDWPEQIVRIDKEDISPNVPRVDYRTFDGVRQMLIVIPSIRAGETAHALVTFELERRDIVAPQDTTIFDLPKRPGRELGLFLAPSPYIESRHPKIRALAKEVTAGKETGWAKAEAIYDWVRENIKYKEGPIKGAMAALKDGEGDCEELSSLFIALCRAEGIPARTVWVQGHCYPEFYLVDDTGEGHWFPCQAAGDRLFGEMKETRPILQKGDNFQVPERRDRVRYVSEFLTGAGGSPKVRWVRESVAAQ